MLFRSILIGKDWESSVLGIISIVQFFLLLMILGVYFGDIRIGNSPFTLTRNEIPAPIFSQPNYLQFLKDGMGLNVLLRNYWMVIHPPVLFLGYAALTVSSMAHAQTGDLDRSVRHFRMCGLRAVHHVVSGRDRHQRRSPGDSPKRAWRARRRNDCSDRSSSCSISSGRARYSGISRRTGNTARSFFFHISGWRLLHAPRQWLRSGQAARWGLRG